MGADRSHPGAADAAAEPRAMARIGTESRRRCGAPAPLPGDPPIRTRCVLAPSPEGRGTVNLSVPADASGTNADAANSVTVNTDTQFGNQSQTLLVAASQ